MAQIGPYRLVELLGRGGMGAVHRAIDTRDGAEVALKLLASAGERPRRRLVREARALARLRHPNIVSVLDAGEADERPWVALELVRGCSLEQHVGRHGPMTPKDAARVAVAIARGITQAHRRGILHRDIKPANVLLPADGGEPKLTDFGLAGFLDEQDVSGTLTRSGAPLGTPGFWAPEQATGRRSELGPATDVYGLGALLHAAVTGRPPVTGETFIELLVATTSQVPEPTGVDPLLDTIIARCLEKRPQDRYAAADDVARELWAYVLDLPRGREIGRATRRSDFGRAALRPALVVGGVAAVLVAAGLALWSAGRRRAGHEPTPAALAGGQGVAGARAAPSAAPADARPPEELPSAQPPAPAASSPPAPTPSTAPVPSTFASGDAPAGAAPVTGAPVVSAEERAFAATIERLMERRAFDEAFELLDRLLQERPTDPLALFHRGRVRLSFGDVMGAAADFDAVLRQHPNWLGAIKNRALAAKQSKDLAGALRYNDRLLALAPDDVLTLLDRGILRQKLGDAEGALQDLDRAVQLAPGAVVALLARAEVKVELKDYPGCLADLDTAIELAPETADAYALRGLAKLRTGRLTAALADIDRSLELDPRHATSHLNRAVVHELLGRLDAALEDWTQLIRFEPQDPQHLIRRAKLHHRMGNLALALQDFDRAVAAGVNHPELLLFMADLRERTGDGPGALAELDRAFALAPHHDLLVRRSELNARLGRAAAAVEDLERAAALAPPQERSRLAERARRLRERADTTR